MAVDADAVEQLAEASPDVGREAGYAVDDIEIDGDSSNQIVTEAPSKRHSPVWMATVVSAAMAVGLVALGGWLGYDSHRNQRADDQRNMFVEVAKQGAMNLTTINYTEVDKDVQRILDSSTGAFRDDFQKRAKPFIDVVKQMRSVSTGIVSDAGLESRDGNRAQVLVAVSVKTVSAGAPEQEPRRWRMRISVQDNGADAKVSNVEFVP